MAAEGLIIRPQEDTVAVVTENVKKGQTVICKKGEDALEIMALEDIPIYHKISLRDMKRGEKVIKYGQPIGRLLEDVRAGGYIHTHNLGRMEE